MNYFNILLLTCISFNLALRAAAPTSDKLDKPIRLTDPILATVDGRVIKADNINNSILAGRMLLIFMDGGNLQSLPSKDIEVQGKTYLLEDLLATNFRGKKSTLKELVQYEEKAITDQEKKEVKDALKEAKKKFNLFMNRSMAEARGTKQMAQQLMTDSLNKRKRTNSPLSTYAKVEEGKEEESLEKEITSCKLLYILCHDLFNFLRDVVHSCPKAVADFKARQQKQR